MTPKSLRIAFVYDDDSSWQGIDFYEADHGEKGDIHSILGIVPALEALGHNVLQIDGIKNLVKHLASDGYNEWDLVFNAAGGTHGLGREAQVPSLLEAYDIPFTFAAAATSSLCMDKGRTKIILDHLGFATAPFAIVPSVMEIDPELSTSDKVQIAIKSSRHAVALGQYPLFAKPVEEHTSKGICSISKIKTPEDLAPTIGKLEALYGGQDILLESFLSGREITVGIVGTAGKSRVIGANEYVYKRSERSTDGKVSEYIDFASDSVKNAPVDKNPHLQVVTADLADSQVERACQLALAAWKALGCRDAGRIDLRFDRTGDTSVPNILEVNPIPGIIPGWSDLWLIAVNNGISYGELLQQIIDSALERSKTSTRRSPLLPYL